MNKLPSGMKRRIKRKLTGEKPTIWIGKSGISQELLKEIEKQLEKREIIKIRILRSAFEGNKAKQVSSKIAEQTKASLVEVRGHTFTLYKRRKR